MTSYRDRPSVSGHSSRSQLHRRFTAMVFAVSALLMSACAVETTAPLSDHEAEHSPALADRAVTDVPSLVVVGLTDGETVTSPVRVRAEISGLDLAPAGRVSDGEAHLHIIINQPCVAAGMVIPEGDAHLHVGTGASFADVPLPVGTHKLCVQAGDGFHTAITVLDELTVVVDDDTIEP